MAYTGKVVDIEVNRKAAGSILQAQALLGLVNGSLTSLAAAQAQCATGQALLSITQRNYAVHAQRGLTVAAAGGAAVSGGSIATALSVLPSSTGHQRRMIS